VAACLSHAGRLDEARPHIKAFEGKRPGWYDVKGFARWACRCLRSPDDRYRLLDGLSKAGFDVS
jgi:hypothetical protein